MGKCISKHPSTLTLGNSHKDLSADNGICCDDNNSSECVALNHKPGNQLDEADGIDCSLVEGNVQAEMQKYKNVYKQQEKNFKHHGGDNIEFNNKKKRSTTNCQWLENKTTTAIAATLKADIIKQQLHVKEKNNKNKKNNSNNVQKMELNKPNNKFLQEHENILWHNNNNNFNKNNNCQINVQNEDYIEAQKEEEVVENRHHNQVVIENSEEQAKTDLCVKSSKPQSKAFDSNNENELMPNKIQKNNKKKSKHQMSKLSKYNPNRHGVKKRKTQQHQQQQINKNLIITNDYPHKQQQDELQKPIMFIEVSYLPKQFVITK